MKISLKSPFLLPLSSLFPWGLFIESYRSELLLFFAIDISCVVQVGLYLFRIGVEVITQRLQ